MNSSKPHLSFMQIINMNVGFFDIQYSFGLQQSAVNPIYDFLGARPDETPWLNLAGPLTGITCAEVILMGKKSLTTKMRGTHHYPSFTSHESSNIPL